jgi:hypothetical protein
MLLLHEINANLTNRLLMGMIALLGLNHFIKLSIERQIKEFMSLVKRIQSQIMEQFEQAKQVAM